HTTAATWVVITSTVFATNIAADHDGEACSRVTTRAGSATSRTAKHRAYGRLARPRRVSRGVGPAPGGSAGGSAPGSAPGWRRTPAGCALRRMVSTSTAAARYATAVTAASPRSVPVPPATA